MGKKKTLHYGPLNLMQHRFYFNFTPFFMWNFTPKFILIKISDSIWIRNWFLVLRFRFSFPAYHSPQSSLIIRVWFISQKKKNFLRYIFLNYCDFTYGWAGLTPSGAIQIFGQVCANIIIHVYGNDAVKLGLFIWLISYYSFGWLVRLANPK